MHVQSAHTWAWRDIGDLVADVLTGSPSAIETLLCVRKNPVVFTSSVVMKGREMVTLLVATVSKKSEKNLLNQTFFFFQ